MKIRYAIFVATFLAIGLAALGAKSSEHKAPFTPAPSPDEPTLAEVRGATERFRDVNVAMREGYIRDPFNLCDTAEMMGRPAALGAMGIHFFRPDLLGITAPPSPRVNGTGTHTDFRKPSILIYEPQRDGSLELIAVENLVFAEAWRAAGHTERPTFHGVPYDTMSEDPNTPIDEAHMFEPHFDRHGVDLSRESKWGFHAIQSSGDVRQPSRSDESLDDARLALISWQPSRSAGRL